MSIFSFHYFLTTIVFKSLTPMVVEIPRPYEPTTLSADPSWVPHDGTRNTLHLVWTCVLTLILSGWTTLHMNIAPRDTRASTFKRFVSRARTMVIAVLMPPLMVAAALNQYSEAKTLSKVLTEIDKREPEILQQVVVGGTSGGGTTAPLSGSRSFGKVSEIPNAFLFRLRVEGSIQS